MWAVIGVAVAWHEFACEEEELLSSAYDRALAKAPVLVYVVTAVTVAHLLNKLPYRLDPFHWGYLISKHITKGTK